MMRLTLGRATRRLRELLALAIVATWCSAAGAVGLVYVDGSDDLPLPGDSPYTTTPQNLFPAAGGQLSDALDAFGSTGTNFTDGKWGYRAEGFGSRGTIYETAAESAPELYQVLTGLTPNAFYDVYVAYWSSTGNWGVRAGTSSNPDANPIFDRNGTLGTAGYPAVYADFDVLPQDSYTATDEDGAGVLTQEQNAVTMEGNRDLYLGPAALNFQANGSGEIRIYIDDLSSVSGERSFFDGLAYAPAGTPVAMTIEIDRLTGNAQLVNPTDQAFRVARLGINSASGVLDPSEWITIAGNTDANGNSTRDTDPWEVTDPNPANPMPSRATALREIEVDDDMMGLDSDGALIPANSSIDLGNIWIRSPYEDVRALFATLLVASPTAPNHAVPVKVNFVNGTPLDFGDFDFDGDIDAEDYGNLLTNMHRSLTSLTISEAYLYGDMTGDRVTTFNDIVAFGAAYDEANGAGAFALLTGAQVPEPATIAVFGLAACALGLCRRWQRATSTVAAVALLAATASVASAQNVTYIDAEPSNTVLENGGAFVPGAPGGAGVNISLNANGTTVPELGGDGLWNVRLFGNQSTAAWGAGGSNFTVFEGGAAENVDRLVTTFNLPANGLYQIYAFIWDDTASSGSGWDADIQLGDRAIQTYKPLADGVSFEAANLPSIVGNTAVLTPGTVAANALPNDIDTPAGTPGNRNMYAAPLGIWSTAVDGNSVSVKVDTSLIAVPNAERTWYDGVGYAPIVDPILVLEVNRATGEVELSNTFNGPVTLSYYEIESASGSLNRTTWNSLDAQNIDAVDGPDGGTTAGDSLLEGWDKTGSDVRAGDFNTDGSVDAADYVVWRNGLGDDYTVQDYVDWKANYGESGPLTSVNVLSETNLLGDTTIAGNSSISLGNIYNMGIDGQDLVFRYGLVADGSLVNSTAFYSGAPGGLLAAASVPEPGTLVLTLMAGLACAGFVRQRNRA